jgi:hypothetical protein
VILKLVRQIQRRSRGNTGAGLDVFGDAHHTPLDLAPAVTHAPADRVALAEEHLCQGFIDHRDLPSGNIVAREFAAGHHRDPEIAEVPGGLMIIPVPTFAFTSWSTNGMVYLRYRTLNSE